MQYHPCKRATQTGVQASSFTTCELLELASCQGKLTWVKTSNFIMKYAQKVFLSIPARRGEARRPAAEAQQSRAASKKGPSQNGPKEPHTHRIYIYIY